MRNSTEILPSFHQTRGDELARKLQQVNSYALPEKHRAFVQQVAKLVYHMSPIPRRELPSFAELQAAHRTAIELQSAAFEEAEFTQTHCMKKLEMALVNDQGRRTDLIRIGVVIMTTAKALAMGLATVPITEEQQREQRKTAKGREIPFVRNRAWAQNCHQEARELLGLLQPRTRR